MVRKNDKVFVTSSRSFGIVNAATLVAGALMLSVNLTADDGTPAGGDPIEALASEVRLIESAAPVVLEGATLNFGDKSRVAATVVGVSKSGKSVDLIVDSVSETGVDENDDPTYSYTPNPYGAAYSARQHSDGKWYVTGTKVEITVTIGYRFTALAAAAAAAAA